MPILQHIKAEKPEDNSEDLDMEIVDTSDRMTCFVLFRKFMKEVCCICKELLCIMLFNRFQLPDFQFFDWLTAHIWVEKFDCWFTTIHIGIKRVS